MAPALKRRAKFKRHYAPPRDVRLAAFGGRVDSATYPLSHVRLTKTTARGLLPLEQTSCSRLQSCLIPDFN
jgi:hypothetical protein